MDGPTIPEQELQSPLKRPAAPPRGLYPRKRALLACQVCRKKKSKCDNLRPSCGSCSALQVVCDYGDFSPNHSSYDPASLEILEQLSQVKELLQTQRTQTQGIPPGVPARYRTHSLAGSIDVLSEQLGSPSGTSPASHRGQSQGLGYIHNHGDEASLLSKSLKFEVSTCNAEHILDWFIFANKYNRQEIESMVFNPEVLPEASLTSTKTGLSRTDRGINDQDALELIDRFLTNVHIKNPIFSIDEVRGMGKHVMEHGFDWDARSCFVLIICALGCISASFNSGGITSEVLPRGKPTNSMDDADNYATAKSYYIAARKRYGLLEHSILAAQCHFLSGVFEAYCLKPLRAWTSFKEACVAIQVCLKTKGSQGHNVNDRFERRLYWSCLKSECELRVEMDLPTSGLAKVDFSEQFPLPPSLNEHPSESSHFGTQPSSDHTISDLDRRMEQSWIYFLSDISHRHIATRLVNLFYQQSADKWLSIPVDRMIRVAHELYLQLSQWYNHVPYMHSSSEPAHADIVPEELVYVTRVRFVVLIERIHRPFLYLAIHLPASDPVRQLIMPYAEQCLNMCFELTRGGSHRHRHHGTWTQNRIIFSACILIMAAVKSRHVAVPDDWPNVVKLTITGLQYWENEAPDLRQARLILERMLADVQQATP